MSRILNEGELGVILVPFVARRTESNDLDGFEDALITLLEDDDLVKEVFMTRVLDVPTRVPVLTEGIKELLRERALNAADVAAALIAGDEELSILIEPWLAKKFPHRKNQVRP